MIFALEIVVNVEKEDIWTFFGCSLGIILSRNRRTCIQKTVSTMALLQVIFFNKIGSILPHLHQNVYIVYCRKRSTLVLLVCKLHKSLYFAIGSR